MAISGAEPKRVLIASNHPLFAQGLRGLLQKRQEADVTVVGIVTSVEQALDSLKTLRPDLLVVDYDDERVNRDEMLAKFVEGQGRLRVVLLSLKEGGDQAVVYDRRTMAASQIEDWLENWKDTEKPLSGTASRMEEERGEAVNSNRRGNMFHIVAVILVIAALTVAVYTGFNQANLLPLQASVQGEPIDGLFNLHFMIISFLFSLIVGFMVYSVVVFRRRKGDTTDGPHIEGNSVLEVVWTLVPLTAVTYVSILGAQVLGQTTQAEPRALEIRVVGQQWAWRFEYPEYGIISNEMYLPVDKQALLLLESTDVIHSFWVPEFRVKQDALPGGEAFIRPLRVTPKVEGDYKVYCAEMCGQQHAYMEAPVHVLSQADFDAWIASQTSGTSDDPVVRGEALAEQFGCIACHTTDGNASVGPTWAGLYGSEEALEDGSTITVDHAYLYESIRDPEVKVTAGFPNIMPPNIADDMSDEQIEDIIAYIESLR